MKEGGIINLGAPKKYEPSEWMTDEEGRRYRMIGKNCKEYEMIVMIDGYPVPQSQVDDFHRRRKELQNKK